MGIFQSAHFSRHLHMSTLTHFDSQGQAHMVDVAAKAPTHRTAVASGRIDMLPETLALIASGTPRRAMCWALPALPASRVPSAPAN
jgi:hypothetical protein